MIWSTLRFCIKHHWMHESLLSSSHLLINFLNRSQARYLCILKLSKVAELGLLNPLLLDDSHLRNLHQNSMSPNYDYRLINLMNFKYLSNRVMSSFQACPESDASIAITWKIINVTSQLVNKDWSHKFPSSHCSCRGKSSHIRLAPTNLQFLIYQFSSSDLAKRNALDTKRSSQNATAPLPRLKVSKSPISWSQFSKNNPKLNNVVPFLIL